MRAARTSGSSASALCQNKLRGSVILKSTLIIRIRCTTSAYALRQIQPEPINHISLKRSERVRALLRKRDQSYQGIGSSGIAGMKRLMEGEGMAIEQKYGGVEYKYIGCFTVITSNTLPFNSMDPEDANAFKARCLLCKSEIPTQSGEEAFPLTAPLVARFLNARFLAGEKEKNAIN
ncbi:hypothetical protein OXYTRIMIC_669 [Oxytricha trifallax]|uniref:Uncharacterized protein n=1 Tax=Oxytricha trifallax TaxID=1172189 RepID=A0A073HXW4_9SPIT|nr:hypothetical protein OXYTRIMIC_669 [Oxytricha trifallax]